MSSNYTITNNRSVPVKSDSLNCALRLASTLRFIGVVDLHIEEKGK